MHADHVTGTGILKNLTNCKSVIAKISGAKADVFIKDGDKIDFGDQVSQCLSVYATKMFILFFTGLVCVINRSKNCKSNLYFVMYAQNMSI